MSITSLPPGFRFHPTDAELIKYYLKRKVLGKKLVCDVIAEVDIYKNEPWDLPDKSFLPSRDLKWYFFCPRERKYAVGGRLNRATERGYWKTTGKDRPVVHNAKHVGMIKTLVFHQGRAPKGDRTDWVMHEYRLDEKDLADKGVVQDAFVLCMIFQKEGPGPRNGAQYGAPFKDEWSSDDEDIINCADRALSEQHQPSQPFMLPPPTQSYSEVTAVPFSDSTCTASTSGPGRSEIHPYAGQLLPVSENVAAYQDAPFMLLPTRSHSEVTMCNAPMPGSARSETPPSAGELVPVAEDVDFSNMDLSQILEDGDFFSMSDLLQDNDGSYPARNFENENYDIFEGLEDLETSIQLKDLEKPL